LPLGGEGRQDSGELDHQHFPVASLQVPQAAWLQKFMQELSETRLGLAAV
jgi:hypothetical protein